MVKESRHQVSSKPGKSFSTVYKSSQGAPQVDWQISIDQSASMTGTIQFRICVISYFLGLHYYDKRVGVFKLLNRIVDISVSMKLKFGFHAFINSEIALHFLTKSTRCAQCNREEQTRRALPVYQCVQQVRPLIHLPISLIMKDRALILLLNYSHMKSISYVNTSVIIHWICEFFAELSMPWSIGKCFWVKRHLWHLCSGHNSVNK